MNKPPEILLDSGFVTDQNGLLTEIVIPSVVTTCNVPHKVTFEGQTLNWMPSTAAALQELELSNMTSIAYTTSSVFTLYNYTALQSFKAPKLQTLNSTGGAVNGASFLRNCTALTNVDFSSLTNITSYRGPGIMYGCTALSSIVMPELRIISDTTNNPGDGGTTYGIWNSCIGLVSVLFPKLDKLTCDYGTFTKCTSLTSVQFGSIGYPVSSISSTAFRNCTQAGLTITIYTTGGASLAGEPWGATNADTDIIYEVA